MKRPLLLLALLLLAGCAPQYPLNTNLQLSVQGSDTGIYDSTDSAAIISGDRRASREIVVYENQEQVALTNIKPVHLIVSNRLAGGLRQQGLTIDSTSPVTVKVDIVDLQATVSRAKMIYHTTAESRVNLRLEHNGRTLGKKYNHQSSRESLKRPEVDELEELLEMQLSDIVGQILADEAVRDFIKGQ